MECSSLWSVACYHDMLLIRDYKQLSVCEQDWLRNVCIYLTERQSHPLLHP